MRQRMAFYSERKGRTGSRRRVYTMVDRWRVGGFQMSNYTNMNGFDLYGNLALGQEWSSFDVVGCFVLFVSRNIPRNQALRPIYCKTSPGTVWYWIMRLNMYFTSMCIQCQVQYCAYLLHQFSGYWYFIVSLPSFTPYPLPHLPPHLAPTAFHISTPRPHHKFTFPYPNICPD